MVVRNSVSYVGTTEINSKISGLQDEMLRKQFTQIKLKSITGSDLFKNSFSLFMKSNMMMKA